MIYNRYAKHISRSLVVQNGRAEINFKGLKLETNLDHLGVEPTLLEGTFEAQELGIFLANLNVYDVFIDVGANIGVYSALALNSDHFHGSVYAFEPNLETFQILNDNLEKYKKNQSCFTFVKAVADTQGYIRIVNKEVPSAVSIENRGKLSKNRELESQIEVTTLDSEFHNILGSEARIFIKVDVEGAEPLVVLGGKLLIQSRKPDLLLEVSKENSQRVGCDWQEAAKLLEETYEKCFILGPKGVTSRSSVYDSILEVTGSAGLISMYLTN
jgi:FkbM family methyltransferase